MAGAAGVGSAGFGWAAGGAASFFFAAGAGLADIWILSSLFSSGAVASVVDGPVGAVSAPPQAPARKVNARRRDVLVIDRPYRPAE